MNGISLSGKTRLTHREAVALLEAAYRGEAEIECCDENEPDKVTLIPLGKAIAKLKTAIDIAGGYEMGGTMIDPFKR